MKSTSTRSRFRDTPIPRIRVCYFCRKKIGDIDFKDPNLTRYLNSWGKIRSRRSTGACAMHQRKLARAIKRARELAILPYTRG